jgi:hypothetical protein
MVGILKRPVDAPDDARLSNLVSSHQFKQIVGAGDMSAVSASSELLSASATVAYVVRQAGGTTHMREIANRAA